jgi:glycosyltransferase involved in cell wall biosynthesis
MSALANALQETGQIDLAVASAVPGADWSKITKEGITHFCIPIDSYLSLGRFPSQKLIDYCIRVVQDFGPDLVHIHGTEYFYGVCTAEGYITCPTVISIQGLIHECYKHVYGRLDFKELITAHSVRDWLRWDGLFQQKVRWKKQALVENCIIAGNSYFIGRTLWDKAHIREINPRAIYFHCDELMRPPFYVTVRNPMTIRRHSIFTPTGCYPLKGLHFVLKAASILKDQFRDIQVRVPDALIGKINSNEPLVSKLKMPGYSKYLRGLIKDLNLLESVVPLGRLAANEMARELSEAHIFIVPSLIENGCNSLNEAQLVGTPAVVSFSGGMQTIIKDGVSALCFPPADYAVMAECARLLFEDDCLASKIANSSREMALLRHSKKTIVKNMLEIYSKVSNSPRCRLSE